MKEQVIPSLEELQLAPSGNTYSLHRSEFALRRELSLLAMSIRKSSIPEDVSLITPQTAEDDFVFLDGRNMSRKRILLLSPACTVATCTMCPLPNEAIYGERKIPTSGDIVRQFDSAFDNPPEDDPEVITVYNNGNFFVDQEIPPEVRQHIYSRVREGRASTLVVESLPQFIDKRKTDEAKSFLGDKRLAVSIGLQTSNDQVRRLAVNTTCTNAGFERATGLLKDKGYLPLVFLMIKPPFLTEKESVADAIESVEYLSRLDIKEPILCPTRVAPNTVVDLLYQNKMFNPPCLSSRNDRHPL